MHIVINTCSLLKTGISEKSKFFKDCINYIIKENQNHSFILIREVKNNKDTILPNQIDLTGAPSSKALLLWKFWYSYTLPKILKKHQAHLFINIDCISVNVDVPQCLMIPDFNTITQIGFGKKRNIEILNKAALLITHSTTDKAALIKQYSVPGEKIAVIPLAAHPNFVPIDFIEKESLKEKYAAGMEYFLFIGEISSGNNLITLLKAFSFFKKRQKSNMQLLIATKAVLPDNAFIKSLASYKYKADVKLYFDLSQQEYVKIMAAAYAFIDPALVTTTYIPILQAMQCGVPVILNETVLLKEVCGNAALFTESVNFENLADKMMLLYKDENCRSKFIEHGLQQSRNCSLANSSQLLWKFLSEYAKRTN